MSGSQKVTYVTLSADNDDLHAHIDAAIAEVKPRLGRTTPHYIGGKARAAASTTESRSPTDRKLVVARAGSGTADDVNDAVEAARAALPAWRARPWQERAALLERAAEIVRVRRYELAVWLMLEMGKNRVEAMGEIEETADLISYYNAEMKRNDGFVAPMAALSPSDTNTSVLRPYGVWAVIAPWNFPFALLGAPVAAALLAGNTIVMKPSSETPLSGVLLAEIFQEAGLPAGAVNLVTGSGRVVGDGLAHHPGVDGLTFTGSYDVGFKQLYQGFSRAYPKPCIVEMGGKNPAIVMDSADLDRAALGVYRSAFGMNGHKCSACSRLYVHRKVADDLVGRIEAKLRETVIGDPLERQTFLGPLATKAGFEDFRRFMAAAHDAKAVRTGGEVLSAAPFDRGFFVRPAILTGLAPDHALMRDELFVPILSVRIIDDLDQALREANDTTFGLTAGFYSRKQDEIDVFLDRIEAGVVYVNRPAGATTGAWPGVQPFGGWKGSGSTGKNIGGHYTVPCYMREQSRTVTG